MNTIHHTTTDTDDDEALPASRGAVDAILAAFAGARQAAAERAPYVAACLASARRLAAWSWANRDDSDQAETIVRALASIYNGSDARGVRLDELRWLEWPHQRDLVAVLLGTGQPGTEDTHIRAAYDLAGGYEAVHWFHQHLDG